LVKNLQFESPKDNGLILITFEEPINTIGQVLNSYLLFLNKSGNL